MILKNNNQKIDLGEFNINEDVKRVLFGTVLGRSFVQTIKKRILSLWS